MKPALVRTIVVFALCLPGCAPPSSEDAGAAAARYAEERWPGSTMGAAGEAMPPVVTDAGENWRVTFRLPEGWAGETPTIELRKEDLEIVNAFDPQTDKK